MSRFHAASARPEAGAQTRILTALAAFALSLPLLWGAGFAGADALHDTAHDARHATGLPCH